MFITKDVETKIESFSESLNSSLTQVNEKLDSLKNDLFIELKEIKEKLFEVDLFNQKLIYDFNLELKKIKTTTTDLNRELDSIKLSKSNMISKLSSEIHSEMNNQMKLMKTDFDSYNNLKNQFLSVGAQSLKAQNNLEKLNKIMSNIKTLDFTLTSYAKQVNLVDKEKVALMKRVNDLERIISAERRNKRRN